MNELIKRAQNGDEKAMAKIIEENVGLVWNIVRRFLNRGYEKEDIFQIGCLGFIKAIKRFDLGQVKVLPSIQKLSPLSNSIIQ